MKTLSLRVRLTLWYTLALFVVLSVCGVEALYEMDRIAMRRIDRELASLSHSLTRFIEEELHERATLSIGVDEAVQTISQRERAFAVFDERGSLIAASWGGLRFTDPLPDLTEGPRTWTVYGDIRPSGWRVRANIATLSAGRVIVLTGGPVGNTRGVAQEAMFVAFPIALMLCAVGGFWLASAGLRPITAMADQAARIPMTGLQDLGESGRRDELGTLARAFNGLLSRLRSLLTGQRQFMADASHELRTPLSVMRSAADITLSQPHRDEAEYREALAIVSEQAARAGRLVDDMLALARADAGGYPLHPVPLYLDEIVAKCVRTADLLARERGVRLELAPVPEIPFRGDEELLQRMLMNVLQNAVRYTPSNGTVSIGADIESSGVIVRVRDQGPGIDPADRERIFDRFVRLDPARGQDGTGLGLPIARWIAVAHGGSLDVEKSDRSGSTFRVVLPTPTVLAAG
jgi:two-component system OmpR family sensor kinase